MAYLATRGPWTAGYHHGPIAGQPRCQGNFGLQRGAGLFVDV